MEEVVLVDDRGAVRLLTLNRPERRNAIDIPLRIVLAEQLRAIESSSRRMRYSALLSPASGWRVTWASSHRCPHGSGCRRHDS